MAVCSFLTKSSICVRIIGKAFLIQPLNHRIQYTAPYFLDNYTFAKSAYQCRADCIVYRNKGAPKHRTFQHDVSISPQRPNLRTIIRAIHTSRNIASLFSLMGFIVLFCLHIPINRLPCGIFFLECIRLRSIFFCKTRHSLRWRLQCFTDTFFDVRSIYAIICPECNQRYSLHLHKIAETFFIAWRLFHS